MKFIGITGGVGAGKSAILQYLEKKENVRVMYADEIAHELMEPDTPVYQQICTLFEGEELLALDGNIDRPKMAALIFSDASKRQQLNAIVHPAVKEYVKKQFALEKSKGELRVLVLEAALLIEEKYDEICDELWYIDSSEENRRLRLKESRGYSDEKIDGIFASQLPCEVYRKACQVSIDNNGSLEDTFIQIERALRRNENE